MTIQEIINKVEEVNSTSNYWFIRTDYGKQFNNFYKGGYIAIGWDYLTLDELRNQDAKKIKKKIATAEKCNLETANGKRQVTTIRNKIRKFINLKKEDIVIIPSRDSNRLAFGRILDDEPYNKENAKEYGKRRKVQWVKISQMNDLNPIFYKVKSNQHTISSVNNYAKFIDREIGTLFKKRGNTHYVLNIEKEESINFNELKNLIDNIDTLLININDNLEFNENFKDFYVKINLQSKGTLELIKTGKSLAVLAYLLFLSSCENLDNEKDTTIQNLINENKDLIENTQSNIDSLQVNIHELTKPFKNGN